MIQILIRHLLLLAISIFTLCPLAQAQAGSSPESADAFTCSTRQTTQEGERIVSRTQAAYTALHSLQAHFVQTSYLAALDHSETSSGTVWFLKQGRMRWEYNHPEPQTFLVRDHTLWLYQPELKQAIVDKFDNLFISDLPVAFLLGIGNIKEDFTLRQACRNSSGLVLELEPKSASSQSTNEQLRRFFLLVQPDTYLPAGARVFDTGGNTTSIILSSTQADPAAIDDSLFAADFPAGTDISDRRLLEGLK